MNNNYIDLSHVIEDGTITYKGLPAPVICDFLSREDSKKFYEEDTSFQIGKIEMVSNTGTYLDCPFHRYEDGDDLSQLALSNLVDLHAEIFHIPYQQKLDITADDFKGVNVTGKAVLVHTGWAGLWGTDSYFENHPFLTKEAAEYLKDQQVKLVGIDSHNIDDTRTKSRPAHTILLGANILIVEHLCNLEQIPTGPFTFTALPPKFKGVGTFPVRAIAKV